MSKEEEDRDQRGMGQGLERKRETEIEEGEGEVKRCSFRVTKMATCSHAPVARQYGNRQTDIFLGGDFFSRSPIIS
jgi:hypothetical protein